MLVGGKGITERRKSSPRFPTLLEDKEVRVGVLKTLSAFAGL